MSKYIPKQGDMVLIPYDKVQREFIAMTSNDKYLCWYDNKTNASIWTKVEPIPEEPTYYYQWESISNSGVISLSKYITDSFAILYDYTETYGWYRIDSSKRTWNH